MSTHPPVRRTSDTVIAVAALLWNLLGLGLFVHRVTMSAAAVAALPAADRAMVEGTPGWVLVAFGIAVVTGVIGSIGLFLRAGWTASAFAVSLGALLVQVVGTFCGDAGMDGLRRGRSGHAGHPADHRGGVVALRATTLVI